MPTRSARNHRRHEGLEGGISVFDEQGRLLPVVDEILQAVSGSGCILGTGRLSREETFALIGRARAVGGVRMLVTHPEWAPTFYSTGQQKLLAAEGDVMFERCLTRRRCGFVPLETIERAIIDTGVENTVLFTDLGQSDTPPPVEGMRQHAEPLCGSGFSVDEVRRMMQANPARLLGLESA